MTESPRERRSLEEMLAAAGLPVEPRAPSEPEQYPADLAPLVRDNPRAIAYAEGALRSAVDELGRSVKGTRNGDLFDAACDLGEFVEAGLLDREVVRQALMAACDVNGYNSDPDDGPEDARKTINSGFRKVAGKARQVRLADRPRDDAAYWSPADLGLRPVDSPPTPPGGSTDGPVDPPGGSPPGGGGGSGDEPEPLRTPWEEPTDLGNARRLVGAFGDQIRYVTAWGRWMVWDGRRWMTDDTNRVARMAKQVGRGLLLEAAHIADDKTRDKVLAWARKSCSARGLRDMITVASSEARVATIPQVFDADPWLLNVANGVVDLRTGELHPHDRTLLLTKIAGAAYRKDSTSTEWMKFLDRVQPDIEMREFLARLFGYSLLGKVTEHVLPILYGSGANGKSTLIEAVTAAMGDYAGGVDPEILIETKATHPTGVADLFGLRLAVTHETDAGRRLAEATVKRLTGGDRITARRMREDFWTFDPSHLAVMLTNHRPVVRGDDAAIWRRLSLVPFPVQIPSSEQDATLRDRLALELDGVLTWLLEGYRDYAQRGLQPPTSVQVATASYRSESDDLERFITDHCIRGSNDLLVLSGMLWESWINWCHVENIQPGKRKAFGISLIEKGFTPDQLGGGKRIWRGIALRSDDDDE